MGQPPGSDDGRRTTKERFKGGSMKKFEVNKTYYKSGITFEIVKRTAKTVTYNALQHAGRSNERIMKTATAKIHNWETREVFFCGDRTIEA